MKKLLWCIVDLVGSTLWNLVRDTFFSDLRLFLHKGCAHNLNMEYNDTQVNTKASSALIVHHLFQFI